MRLIVISSQQQKRTSVQALSEALGSLFDDVLSYDTLPDINLIKDKDCLIVFANSNISNLSQYTNNNPVFLICDDREDVSDDNDCEDIFTTPVRIGNLTESIKNFMKQQMNHEEMAPIMLGDIELNPKTSQLTKDKTSVRLTEKEMDILLYIHKSIDDSDEKFISKGQLLNEVWGYAQNVETHTLETHIYRLRQKLKSNLNLNDFLMTNETGYYLNF